jgi:hypothetical protein
MRSILLSVLYVIFSGPVYAQSAQNMTGNDPDIQVYSPKANFSDDDLYDLPVNEQDSNIDIEIDREPVNEVQTETPVNPFEAADSDGDGRLTQQEWRGSDSFRQNSGNSALGPSGAFVEADKNRDGSLSMSEARTLSTGIHPLKKGMNTNRAEAEYPKQTVEQANSRSVRGSPQSAERCASIHIRC